MALADVIIIISRNGGAFLSRWAHVVVAASPGSVSCTTSTSCRCRRSRRWRRRPATTRSTSWPPGRCGGSAGRRWPPSLTGVLILIIQKNGDKSQLFSGDYIKTVPGMAIDTGILLALTMFLNVWLVIWPNQKKVIANARNVQAGGEADPAAAAAGRKAAMASRQNTIYSFTMLLFMVGTVALLPAGQVQVRAERRRPRHLLDRSSW